MHLMHTGACRDFYLFVEKTFTLRICQIPDLKRHTHESQPSSPAGKQANCVNRLIQLCTHFPKNQIGQTRPLQEHSCISRCHSPAAVRIDLYIANTCRYNSFLSSTIEMFSIQIQRNERAHDAALWSR